jgi:hypothetical protein
MWVIYGFIGIFIGYWILPKYNIHGTFSILLLVACISVVVILPYILYSLFIFYISKDMRVKGAIADYLKRIKHPYYIALRHRIHGEFQKAWGMLPKIKNPKLRAHIETILLLEEHNVNEAEKAIKNINVKSLMNFYYAIVAIIKQDWDNFDKFKNMVKKNGLRYALEADAAFRKGKYDEAKQFGDLAIASTRGLQRFIFVKSLERQEKNPNRESYF